MNYKRIYLAKRVPTAAAEEFAGLWKSHAAFGSQYPVSRGRFVRGRQCSRIVGSDAVPGTTSEYDGVGLIWAKSLETALQKLADPAIKAKFEEDERRVFYDIVANFSVLGEEHVLREGPAENVCVLTFLRARPGTDEATFFASLKDGWMTRAVATPGIARLARRIAVSRVMEERPRGCRYDGVTEFWFDSPEDAGAAFRDPGLAALDATTGAFADPGATVRLLTRITHGWQVDEAGRPI